MPPLSARLPEDAVEPPPATAARRALLPCDGVLLGRDERKTLSINNRLLRCSRSAFISPKSSERKVKQRHITPPPSSPPTRTPEKHQKLHSNSEHAQTKVQMFGLYIPVSTSQCEHGLKEQREIRRTYSADRIKRRGRKICIGGELQADPTCCYTAFMHGNVPSLCVPPPSVPSGTGSAGRTSQHLLTGALVTRR